MRRPLIALAVLLTLAAVAGPAAAAPPGAEAASRYVGNSGPKIALWGDSISNDAGTPLVNRLSRDFRYRGRTLDSSTVRSHIPNVSWLVAAERPYQAIIELGTGDARDGRSAAQMRADIRSMLRELRSVPCVRWLNVKTQGVSPFYAGVVANAERFNQALRTVISSGDFPNTKIVNYAAWARNHPNAFSSDGLHFSPSGAGIYVNWIAGRVAGC